MGNWHLWFVRLSGWPVFLAVVFATVLLAWFISVLLTKTSNRTAVQTMLFAVVALSLIALVLLFVATTLTGAR